MFGIGLPELLLIMGLGLIVLGPDKLPELAKQLAKGMVELKRTANSLKNSLQEEMEDEEGNSPLLDDLQEVAGQPWRGLDGKGGLPTGNLPEGFDEFGVINTTQPEDGVGVNTPAKVADESVADAGSEEQVAAAETGAEDAPVSETGGDDAPVETPERQDNPAA